MRPPRSPDPRRGETPVDARPENEEHVGPLPASPVHEQAELLHEETEQLKEALERRPVVDVARGVPMATWSCTEEEVWQILVRVSQHSNTNLHDVAEAVVATTRQEPMPASLQDHLAAAVAHGAGAEPQARRAQLLGWSDRAGEDGAAPGEVRRRLPPPNRRDGDEVDGRGRSVGMPGRSMLARRAPMCLTISGPLGGLARRRKVSPARCRSDGGSRRRRPGRPRP
ncbi:ANTAR domain-containing protein [Streptomyces sp. AS02]|uniref:ANTAR domain-containing protein n=1 Tax=Streptomyces sp. AS02 TaxID=2938946 RepID=UPI0034D5716D